MSGSPSRANSFAIYATALVTSVLALSTAKAQTVAKQPIPAPVSSSSLRDTANLAGNPGPAAPAKPPQTKVNFDTPRFEAGKIGFGLVGRLMSDKKFGVIRVVDGEVGVGKLFFTVRDPVTPANKLPPYRQLPVIPPPIVP